MTVKNTIEQFFQEEEAQQIDKDHMLRLQRQILANESLLEKGKTKIGSNQAKLLTIMSIIKYILFPAISVAVITCAVILILPTKNINKHIRNSFVIQQVSAEGLLNAMQASINSERLHIIMETSSNALDTSDEADSLGTHTISETWVDRKAHIARLDRKDSQGRLRIMVIKQGLPSEDDITYQFVMGGLHGFNPAIKNGYFAKRTDHDGYENIIDLTLRNGYVDYLKKNDVQVDPSYEQTMYKGHAAYKLTLRHPQDKAGITLTETLILDKETQLPYEDVILESGRDDVPGGTLRMTTLYTFSTGFSNDVFEPKAPKGYTLQNPTISEFDLYMLNYTANSARYALWKQDRALGTLSLGEGDGMMPAAYLYKVFLSKESFPSKEAAEKAENVQFSEIKPHVSKQKLPNQTSQVYTLPDIANNDFSQYGIFKLEVDDVNGKKLHNITQIKQYSEFIPSRQ